MQTVAEWVGYANLVFDKMAVIEAAEVAQPFSFYKLTSCLIVLTLPRIGERKP